MNSQISKPSQDLKVQKEQAQDIRELGKKFIATIHDFAIEKQKDVSYLVAVGACDYVIKSHRARAQALGDKQTQSFIQLEALAKEMDLKYDEPYSQDDSVNTTNPESILLSDTLK